MAHGSRARNVAKEEMCPWGCLSECTNADARGWRVAAEALEHGASGWVGDRAVEARVKPTGGGLVLKPMMEQLTMPNMAIRCRG